MIRPVSPMSSTLIIVAQKIPGSGQYLVNRKLFLSWCIMGTSLSVLRIQSYPSYFSVNTTLVQACLYLHLSIQAFMSGVSSLSAPGSP